MRKLIAFLGCVLLLLSFIGCATPAHVDQAPPAQRYFLDPSVELQNYHTFGFLQVMAVRYAGEAMPSNPAEQQAWLTHHKGDKAIAAHYTDEIVWRVLEQEMIKKGYQQVDPSHADLLIAYYGGPRSLTPMSETRFKPSAFDGYFVRNELKPQSFFVDVIDTKQGSLVYRGWDNVTFLKANPAPEKVINSAHSCLEFFPSKL